VATDVGVAGHRAGGGKHTYQIGLVVLATASKSSRAVQGSNPRRLKVEQGGSGFEPQTPSLNSTRK
jgi:hypothetical protein